MTCPNSGNSNGLFTADSVNTAKAAIDAGAKKVTVTAKPKERSVVNDFPATFQCTVKVMTAQGSQTNCVSEDWDNATQWSNQETRDYEITFPNTPVSVTTIQYDPGGGPPVTGTV